MPDLSKKFFGKRAAAWLLVAVLLLAVFFLDYSLMDEFPFIDLAWAVPIAAAAILLSPVETIITGLLAMSLCLTTQDAAGEFTAENIWLAGSIGAFGLLAALLSFYARRFFLRAGSPHRAVKGSPLAYARFGFPGYNLVDYNSAFEQMANASGDRGLTSLASSFRAETAKRLADYMDETVANKKQVTCEELNVPFGEGKNSYWRVEFIADRSEGSATPKHLTMFALEITEQVHRARIREAALNITTTVMSSLNVDETVRVVLDSLVYITGTDAGALFLLEEDQWERRALFGKQEYEDDEPLRLRTPYDNLSKGVEAIESRKVMLIGSAGIDGVMSKELMNRTKSYMVVPLIAGNRAVGAAWLNQMEYANPFTQDQVEFAGVIGSHGALAIENASIYEKEQAARKSLEAIETVSEAGLVSLDMEEILKELVNRTQNVMKMDAAVILLLNESREFLEIRAMTGDGECPMPDGRIRIGEGLAGKAVETNAPMKIDNLRGNPGACPLFGSSGLSSALAVPLRINGVVEGVLGIGSMKEAAFTVGDWELIQVIADRASLAVQNSMLHNETQLELTKVGLLKDVAAVCAGPFDLVEIANRALESISRRLGCRVASVYYLDDKAKTLVNLAFVGPSPGIIEHLRVRPLEDKTMLVRAALEQRMLTQQDLDMDNISEGDAFILKGLNADENRLCTLPLIYKNETVGAMAMLFPDRNPFTPSMIDTIKSLANQLAVAIHSHSETVGNRTVRKDIESPPAAAGQD